MTARNALLRAKVYAESEWNAVFFIIFFVSVSVLLLATLLPRIVLYHMVSPHSTHICNAPYVTNLEHLVAQEHRKRLWKRGALRLAEMVYLMFLVCIAPLWIEMSPIFNCHVPQMLAQPYGEHKERLGVRPDGM